MSNVAHPGITTIFSKVTIKFIKCSIHLYNDSANTKIVMLIPYSLIWMIILLMILFSENNKTACRYDKMGWIFKWNMWSWASMESMYQNVHYPFLCIHTGLLIVGVKWIKKISNLLKRKRVVFVHFHSFTMIKTFRRKLMTTEWHQLIDIKFTGSAVDPMIWIYENTKIFIYKLYDNIYENGTHLIHFSLKWITKYRIWSRPFFSFTLLKQHLKYF